MKKAILTGLNGTLAPFVAEELSSHGVEIIRWDREQTPIDDYQAMERFIKKSNAEYFLHLATGDPAWAENCANISAEKGMKFLFTSTVSVYDSTQVGPHDINTPAMGKDDYALYKLDCEKRILSVNLEAIIVRLGWQIGYKPEKNNMLTYFENLYGEKGEIRISSKWYPACSFMDDTASGLYSLLSKASGGGIYLLDSNNGMAIIDIVKNLNIMQQNRWTITKDDSFAMDNRMVDDRVKVISLKEKFKKILKVDE